MGLTAPHSAQPKPHVVLEHFVTSPRPRILFYCQSSLGIGHTMRSLRLITGLMTRFDVCLLQGGSAVPASMYPKGLDVISLPPITADEEFVQLRSAAPSIPLEQTLAQRGDTILQTCLHFKPDIVMVELYPFGRRKFGPEIDPLLKQARKQGAQIICSLRDILVPKRDPEHHEARAVEIANRRFDAILVHGDPSFYRLDETFGRVADLRIPILYTGYVAPNSVPSVAPKREPTIVASLGGGRFGHELARAVIAAAHRLSDHCNHRIELYTGPFCPATQVAEWVNDHGHAPNLTIETFTHDFSSRLVRVDLAISLGGYNTTMDILASGVRALMYPCVNNAGMDQITRVKRLAEYGMVNLLTVGDLNPGRLVNRILKVLKTSHNPKSLELNGVEVTTRILASIMNKTLTTG